MASTASDVQRQGREGGGEAQRGDVMSIWCHVCNRQETVSASADEALSSENERDQQQTNIVCPSCGSDFVEIVSNAASGGVHGNIHRAAAAGSAAAAGTEGGLVSLDAASNQEATTTTTSTSGGGGGGGNPPRAGYHFLHGPISVRVETRGAAGVGVPQLLQSLFSAGGLGSLGVDLGLSRSGSGGVQAGDFVFGGNDALDRIVAQLAENHVAASVPASPQVIAKLRRIRCKKEVKACTTENCAICQEGYEEGKFTAIQMPCSHVFHEGCLLQWLKEQNTCPICRLQLPSAASEAEERERVERENISDSNEEMLRRMNDIDEEPPPSTTTATTAASAGEGYNGVGGVRETADQEGSGPAAAEHSSSRGKGVGFHMGHIVKRLASPLGKVLKWASKPLGKVVKLGMGLTDKIFGKKE